MEETNPSLFLFPNPINLKSQPNNEFVFLSLVFFLFLPISLKPKIVLIFCACRTLWSTLKTFVDSSNYLISFFHWVDNPKMVSLTQKRDLKIVSVWGEECKSTKCPFTCITIKFSLPKLIVIVTIPNFVKWNLLFEEFSYKPIDIISK